jgi:hypothetical protein
LKSLLLSSSLLLLVAVPDEVDFRILLSWGGRLSGVHVTLGLAVVVGVELLEQRNSVAVVVAVVLERIFVMK